MPSAPHASSPDHLGVDAVHGRRALFIAAFALRNGTPGPRQLLARAASGGRWGTDELVHRLALLGKHGQDGELAASLDPRAAVQLARLLGTQRHAPSDAWSALLLLRAVHSAHGPAELRNEGRLLLLELLAERGETDAELERWLGTLRRDAGRIAVQVRLLRANVANPFRERGALPGTPAPGRAVAGRATPDVGAWESAVADALAVDGLEPVVVRPGTGVPFDRLSAAVAPSAAPSDAPTVPPAPPSDAPGPLVTVVVMSGDDWSPGAVRSVLGQSHRALEVLVVRRPGHPGAGAWDVDDARVRHVEVGDAGSGVEARNLAVARFARGDLVTLAAGGDWLHPRRVERQAAVLADRPDDVACLAGVAPATGDLVFGRAADAATVTVPGPGTLMMRRTALGTAGYWDPHAPGGLAEAELVARLEAVTGRAVPSAGDAPLTFTRYTPAPRGPHFVGPRARWYTSAYRTWHETSTPENLRLPAERTDRPAVPAPPAVTEHVLDVDVAYVTDFRFPGGNSSVSVNEIQILDDAGYRVAMVHLESPVLGHAQRLHPRALEAARRSGIHLATTDHPVRARLTVVRHPSVLQLVEPRRSAITTGSLAVIVNHAPYEADLGGSYYDAAVVAANAAAVFGVEPTLHPESSIIRSLLEGMLDPRLLAGEDWTGVLPALPAARRPRRPARRGLTGRPRPVIGRHSRDSRAKWPDAAALRAVYPVDGSCDVRVLGGAAKAQERTGIDVLAAWTVHPFGSRPVGEFLDELDFWVYFHGPELYESFGMAIVEALAAGLVVVLPRYLERTFGDAAVYAEPDEVQPLVQRLWNDPAAYTAQSERALAAAARSFGPQILLDRVDGLVRDASR